MGRSSLTLPAARCPWRPAFSLSLRAGLGWAGSQQPYPRLQRGASHHRALSQKCFGKVL